MSSMPMGMVPNWYNQYSNQVQLNDLTGMDIYSGAGMMNPMMNPMMGMNGSIFGGGMGMGMPGMGMPMTNPMMGMGMSPMMGMGMPMMGMNGNYSPEDYYKNYEKYQDFMINNQIRQQQKIRNADLRVNAPQEGVGKQAEILRAKIIENEQEQIVQAMEGLKASVRSMYGDASEEEITTRAMAIYANSFGSTIEDDLRRYGSTSFKQGFLQTLTLGMADKQTAEQNISAITGQPVGRYEKGKKATGNIAGGAVLGAGAAITTSLLFKKTGKGLKGIKSPFFKALFKSKPAVAAVIGSAVGIGAALLFN